MTTIGATSTRTAEPPKKKEFGKADFMRVFIFAAGTFNKFKNTPEHLKSMVEFEKDHANFSADLKIDHIDSKEERDKKYQAFKNFPYSLGKIKGLTGGEGYKKLYGDYYGVYPAIKKALKEKLLTTHSAEIYYNVTSKKTGKKYPAVLGAVALLPAGKLPALWEEFDPYMYELEDCDLGELVTYESKEYFNFSGELPEDNNFIEKESYKMTDQTNPKPAVATAASVPVVDTKELESLRAYKAEAEKTIADIQAQTDQIKKDYAALERRGVEDFVDSLIETENPRLLPKNKEKAVFALMSCDKVQKVEYNLDGAQVQKSNYELVRDLLTNLPVIEGKYSEDEEVPNQGKAPEGDKKEAAPLSNFKELYSVDFLNSDEAHQKRVHSLVLSKAEELKLDVSEKNKNNFEAYAMSLEAVQLENPSFT